MNWQQALSFGILLFCRKSFLCLSWMIQALFPGILWNSFRICLWSVLSARDLLQNEHCPCSQAILRLVLYGNCLAVDIQQIQGLLQRRMFCRHYQSAWTTKESKPRIPPRYPGSSCRAVHIASQAPFPDQATVPVPGGHKSQVSKVVWCADSQAVSGFDFHDWWSFLRNSVLVTFNRSMWVEWPKCFST